MPEDIIRRPTEAPPARRPDVATPPAAAVVDVRPAPAEAGVAATKRAESTAAETPAEADGNQTAPVTSKDKKSSKPIGVIVVAVLVSAALIGLTVYLGMKG